MVLVQWILVIANAAAMPYFLFLAAIALAAIFGRRRPGVPVEPRSRFLIVIPAHDEESGIAATVASCRASDYPESLFGVLVIADNCSDRTAAVAANAGARVVERSHDVDRTKGYAIEYLIGLLIDSGEFESLDALVIVDADTLIDAGLLRRFDARLQAGDDWIQCYYTVSNPDQSWRTRLMTYAFSLFNGVMQQGQAALGSSAGLRGNGMCFSTRGLRRVPWRCYGLVEDMEFSWTLRLAGEKIAFEPASRVFGAMLGSGGAAAANQRRRWEFGRSEIRRKYRPLLLRSPILGSREKLLSLAELTLPTMGVLLAIYLVLAGLDVAMLAFAGDTGGATVRLLLVASGLAMTAAVGLYALSPFVAMRLPLRFAGTLAMFPVYFGWKVLVALGGRPTAWIRTARETRADTPA